jgi:hypothetical protein
MPVSAILAWFIINTECVNHSVTQLPVCDLTVPCIELQQLIKELTFPERARSLYSLTLIHEIVHSGFFGRKLPSTDFDLNGTSHTDLLSGLQVNNHQSNYEVSFILSLR